MWRVILIVVVEIIAVLVVFTTRPDLGERYVDNFLESLPTHSDSPYYRAAAPGIFAFENEPFLGIGPGNLRYLCESVSAGQSHYDCHPHPHNFYIQMLGETGLIGLGLGIFFVWSIVWTCMRPALLDRSNVVVATMWIVPFGLFWPVASTADFFWPVEQHFHVERDCCGTFWCANLRWIKSGIKNLTKTRLNPCLLSIP